LTAEQIGIEICELVLPVNKRCCVLVADSIVEGKLGGGAPGVLRIQRITILELVHKTGARQSCKIWRAEQQINYGLACVLPIEFPRATVAAVIEVIIRATIPFIAELEGMGTFDLGEDTRKSQTWEISTKRSQRELPIGAKPTMVNCPSPPVKSGSTGMPPPLGQNWFVASFPKGS